MKEPDRDTIYTGVLLVCGLPPKPREFTCGQRSTTIVDYSKAHQDWVLLAEHILFTTLRDWIHAKALLTFHRQCIWKEEWSEFLKWIALQQLVHKREEYDEQSK